MFWFCWKKRWNRWVGRLDTYVRTYVVYDDDVYVVSLLIYDDGALKEAAREDVISGARR